MRTLITRMIRLGSFMAAFVASTGAASRIWIGCD